MVADSALWDVDRKILPYHSSTHELFVCNIFIFWATEFTSQGMLVI